MNRKTGTILRGYQIGNAKQEEISEANQNLRASGSEFRYVPSICQQQAVAVHSADG